MKHIIAALASVSFSFFIAQAALASDLRPVFPRDKCKIAKCVEGFSLDAKNCQCVSDRKPKPICRIRCGPDSEFDPKTCECIEHNPFKETDSPKPPMRELFQKNDPSEPTSRDPTRSNLKEEKLH